MGRTKKETSTTYKIRISEYTSDNLNEITGFLSFIKNQPDQAIKVGDAMFAVFDRIQANPFAFKECEELATTTKMYRRATCFSWTIIYKIVGTQITILGIIHQSMRPTAYKKLRKVK